MGLFTLHPFSERRWVPGHHGSGGQAKVAAPTESGVECPGVGWAQDHQQGASPVLGEKGDQSQRGLKGSRGGRETRG